MPLNTIENIFFSVSLQRIYVADTCAEKKLCYGVNRVHRKHFLYVPTEAFIVNMCTSSHCVNKTKVFYANQICTFFPSVSTVRMLWMKPQYFKASLL